MTINKTNYKSCSLNIIRYLIVHGALLLFVLIPYCVYSEEATVVLVASNESNINNVSILDIRRIFLGITPEDTTLVNKPVLNMADKVLYDEFIKNIMHMTEDGYRRKVVKRVFLRGEDYIYEYSATDELIAHLNKNKNDISFMKKADIREVHNIKVVAVLW